MRQMCYELRRTSLSSLTGRSGDVAPVEDDLAGVSGTHGVEALLVVAPVKAVGDDPGDVEAALQHDGHLVPGLVHLATVDSADGELVEDDLVPVDGDVLGGDAEHSDLRAVAHVGEHLAKGGGVAGHLEADVEAFLHVQLLLDLGEGGGAGIDGKGYADFCGEIAPVLIGVGDDDVASACVSSHGGGHDADGTGTGDENVFAEYGKGERGVDGITEGIEDGSDLVVDAGGVLPDVGHGEDDVFGECAVAVDSDALGVGAQMATACETVAAASADDVAFAADELADDKIGDVGTELDNLADEFVADDEAGADCGAGPGIPVVDVQIGAADSRIENADFYVVDSDVWFGNIFKPEAAFAAAFYQCLHEVGTFLAASASRAPQAAGCDAKPHSTRRDAEQGFEVA